MIRSLFEGRKGGGHNIIKTLHNKDTFINIFLNDPPPQCCVAGAHASDCNATGWPWLVKCC